MATSDMDMDVDSDTGVGRRSSIEKKPVVVAETDVAPDDEPTAFERLPDEIVQQYAPF